MKLDHYVVLGVSRDATAEQLKAAYKKMAKLYHPDVNGSSPLAGEKMKEVNDAYRILSNPLLRREYDRKQDDANKAPSPGPSYTPPSGPPPPEDVPTPTSATEPYWKQSARIAFVGFLIGVLLFGVAGLSADVRTGDSDVPKPVPVVEVDAQKQRAAAKGYASKLSRVVYAGSEEKVADLIRAAYADQSSGLAKADTEAAAAGMFTASIDGMPSLSSVPGALSAEGVITARVGDQVCSTKLRTNAGAKPAKTVCGEASSYEQVVEEAKNA